MTRQGNPIIVAIDGPAGAGKSTIAKHIARRLNISYLDTGAMYRAITLKALRQKVNLQDTGELVRLAEKTTIELKEDNARGLKVFLDGEDVSEAIRSLEVTNKTFYIAGTPQIRSIMVQWQRAMGVKTSLVAEGRDIGTVVFPNATKKFYLDANLQERAARRIKEMREKGQEVDEEKLKVDLQERDHKDFTRAVGPLKKAEDAIAIDTTYLSIEEVVEEILEYLKS